jgi:hypothetical protein
MKAIIQDGKIFNFVDDGYIAGNKEIDSGTHESIKIAVIKGFADDVDMEQVKLNATREKGVFKYYLDDKGIVQQLVIEEQPEYKAYQANQRAMAYKTESDSIKMKADEYLYDGDEVKYQEYMTAWKEKKEEIRSKFPY